MLGLVVCGQSFAPLYRVPIRNLGLLPVGFSHYQKTTVQLLAGSLNSAEDSSESCANLQPSKSPHLPFVLLGGNSVWLHSNGHTDITTSLGFKALIHESGSPRLNLVRGSNSTAVFLHISQNVIAQRIISLFNGRSLRLPKGSPFRNPQKPIQEKTKKPKPKKPKKPKPKKPKTTKPKKPKEPKKTNISGLLENCH